MKTPKEYPPQPSGRFAVREIRVILPEAINGFWDGGAKDSFDFSIQIETGGYEKHHGLPWHLKIGSWGANFWFRIPPAADPVKAALRAVRHRVTRRYQNAKVFVIENGRAAA